MKTYKFKTAKIQIDYHPDYCVMVVQFAGAKDFMAFRRGDEMRAFKALKGSVRNKARAIQQAARTNLPAYM